MQALNEPVRGNEIDAVGLLVEDLELRLPYFEDLLTFAGRAVDDNEAPAVVDRVESGLRSGDRFGNTLGGPRFVTGRDVDAEKFAGFRRDIGVIVKGGDAAGDGRSGKERPAKHTGDIVHSVDVPGFGTDDEQTPLTTVFGHAHILGADILGEEERGRFEIGARDQRFVADAGVVDVREIRTRLELVQ